MTKKILVIGGAGLLGSRIVDLASENYDVYATYHSFKVSNPKFFPLDKTDSKATFRLIERIKPALIVDTAALHNVDYCEEHREECKLVNVTGTKNVAEACKQTGSKMIFISTDYVFDGKKSEYREEDKPNPLHYYAKCKLEAENMLQKIGINHAIARTAVIYGRNESKPNFVTWAIDQLKEGKEINIVDDQYSNPTYADDLADIIINIFEKDAQGIFHTTGSEFLSRYDFTLKIADVFGLDKNLVNPIKTEALNQKAPRPKGCNMNTDKISRILGRKPLNVIQGLERMRKGVD